MLDYLEQLIQEQKWEEALVLAEQLLSTERFTVEEQLRINVALVIARASLEEHSGVILLGDHVARMATDLKNWEAYLTVHHYLGYAYGVLNQWADAKQVWLKFIDILPVYGSGHRFEVMTWYHLGIASLKENDVDSAITYYLRARAVAERNGNHRQIVGMNHALIQAYIIQGKFDPVPSLLASAAHHIRSNREAKHWNAAWQWHLQIRASFALATKRYHRAKLIAIKALNSNLSHVHQFHMHMILASVARNQGTSNEMIKHLLCARVAAIRARRYDCEVEAADTLYQVVQVQPSALEMNFDELSKHEIPPAWFELDGEPVRRSKSN
jgi:tetratricopeptide (TPR) repeat protein